MKLQKRMKSAWGLALIALVSVSSRAEGPQASSVPLVPVGTKAKDLSPMMQTAPASHLRRKPVTTKKTHSSSVKLPPLLAGVEKKYSTQGSLTANFSQTTESVALKKTTESSGTIEVRKPGSLRWEQKLPDATLLVSNGKTFWFYTPPFDASEPGQVIIRKSSQVQSRLASSLLMGDFSGSPLESVKQNTPSRFTLIPKAGSAGTISRMEVQINPDSQLIMGVALTHRDGNRTEIHLEGVTLGKEIDDSHFEFQIPKNTQILKE